MSVRIVSALARPDLADQADEATADAFPEYNTHGDIAAPRWSRLYDDYPAYQLVLWDDATGEVLGEANTIPCRYDGTVQGLAQSAGRIGEVVGLINTIAAQTINRFCSSGLQVIGQATQAVRAVAPGLSCLRLTCAAMVSWRQQ